MQLYNRGIRRRLAPMLHGDRRRLEMAYSLMLSLPGTPVIRYGDEIGMGDDLSLPERNACRTPMQWSRDPQGGFTTNPHPKNPVITGGTYGYEHINVADQRRDPNSFMNWMERMIRTRKETPEIGWGHFIVIPTRHRDVLILRYTWQDNSVVIIHNFSADPIDLRFRSSANPRRTAEQGSPHHKISSTPTSPTSSPTTTAAPTPPAATSSCSNPTATAGSASAARMTSSIAPPPDWANFERSSPFPRNRRFPHS